MPWRNMEGTPATTQVCQVLHSDRLEHGTLPPQGPDNKYADTFGIPTRNNHTILITNDLIKNIGWDAT